MPSRIIRDRGPSRLPNSSLGGQMSTFSAHWRSDGGCIRGQEIPHLAERNHVLMTTLVSSALPHILKKMFDQERPDRLTVRGHWRGVPFSGKRLDAFPSGHAVHIGALASAASVLPSRQRNTLWAIGTGLVLTRIVLLAHWTSDVAAGLIVGALTERLIRRFTGYPNSLTRRL